MAEPGGWSLEARLRRRLLAALLLAWLAGAAIAWLGMRHETGEVLDSALEETAQRLLALPEAALGADDPAEALAAEIGAHEEYLIYQVFDRHGRLRLRSHAAPKEALAPNAPEGLHELDGWRIYTLTRDDRRRRVQVAQTLAHRHEVLWESSAWLLGPLAALLPLAAFALRHVLRGGFRTLEPVRRTLANRTATDLQPIPLGDLPQELRPLIAALDALMLRVGDAIDAERSFASRTAHELRTPLAAARAQAQRLARESREPANIARAQALVRQLDRLTTLATRLLQIARIEAGVALQREPVDLAELATLVAAEFADAGQRLRVQIDAPATVEGDVDALGIALRNLIDNALKHGGAEASVNVRVGPGFIGVSDDGPGVPADALATLTRPFERGASAAEGSGLGLAMVQTIARQSGARLELHSPHAAGRGFAASLHFSAAPARAESGLVRT